MGITIFQNLPTVQWVWHPQLPFPGEDPEFLRRPQTKIPCQVWGRGVSGSGLEDPSQIAVTDFLRVLFPEDEEQPSLHWTAVPCAATSGEDIRFCASPVHFRQEWLSPGSHNNHVKDLKAIPKSLHTTLCKKKCGLTPGSRQA